MNLTNILEDFQNFVTYPSHYSLSTESSGTTSDESSSVISSVSSSPIHNVYNNVFERSQPSSKLEAKSSRKLYKEPSFKDRRSSIAKKNSNKSNSCEKRCPKLKINLRKGKSVLIEPEDETVKSSSGQSTFKHENKRSKKRLNPNFQPSIAEKVKLRKRSCKGDLSSEYILEVEPSDWPLEIYDQEWQFNHTFTDIQLDNKHNLELRNSSKDLENTFSTSDELLPPELMFIDKDLMSDFKIDESSPFTLPTLNLPIGNSVLGCVTDAIQSILGNTFNKEDEYHDAKEGICQLLQNGVLKDKIEFSNEDSYQSANLSSLSNSEKTVPLEIAISELTEPFQGSKSGTSLQSSSCESSSFVIPSYELELEVASYVVISDNETVNNERDPIINVNDVDYLGLSPLKQVCTPTQSLTSTLLHDAAVLTKNIANDITLKRRASLIESSKPCEKQVTKLQKLGSGAVFSSIINQDIMGMLNGPSFETDPYTQGFERLPHSSSGRNSSQDSSAKSNDSPKHSFSPLVNAKSNKTLNFTKNEDWNSARTLNHPNRAKPYVDDHDYKKKTAEDISNKKSTNSGKFKRKLSELSDSKKARSVYSLPLPTLSQKCKKLQKRDSNVPNNQINARKRESNSPKEEQRNKAMKERRVVYVGDIPPSYTIQQLRERFRLFGKIEDIQIKSKDNDTKDKLDHEYFQSPHKIVGSGVWSTKQDNKNFFGFITYQSHADATKAIDRGNEGYVWPVFTLNFGGRRQFVKEDYRDLDAKVEIRVQSQQKSDDFACLLEQEKRRLGL